MQEKLKGLLQIVFAIFIVIVVFYASKYIEHFSTLGYFGVFIISLIGNATILLPAPSWVLVFSLGGVLNPYLVGIAAGVGSGLGEITSYIAGRGASHLAHVDERFEKYKDWIRKNDLIAIGLLAAIPNPLFDVAGLAAGSIGINMWRFLIACIIGRTFRYIILAYAGSMWPDALRFLTNSF
ncbi:MAG: VTT domain-containing protein [Candidatus Methanoperedens sp.]|nr:VTT domain-containing protein [Candidatus Methanoperedens sp.]